MFALLLVCLFACFLLLLSLLLSSLLSISGAFHPLASISTLPVLLHLFLISSAPPSYLLRFSFFFTVISSLISLTRRIFLDFPVLVDALGVAYTSVMGCFSQMMKQKRRKITVVLITIETTIIMMAVRIMVIIIKLQTILFLNLSLHHLPFYLLSLSQMSNLSDLLLIP